MTAFVIISLCQMVAAGERYRVKDETLTVWDSPEYLNQLGKMHRGDEFDALAHEGNKLVFEYKGRKAYVAAYCCELIQESAVEHTLPASPEPNQPETGKPVQEEVSTTATSHKDASVSEGATVVNKTVHQAVGRKRGSNNKPDIPEWLALALGVVFLLGCIVGFWNIFGRQSSDNFFNGLAGKDVTGCSTLTRFRPAIVFVIFGMTGTLSDNYTLAILISAVYEIGLLAIRTRQLGSFRAASVEAIYLGLNAIGVFAVLTALVILMFLASGGSSRKKEENKKYECKDCRHYQWASNVCEKGYVQDGTCRDFG